MIRCFTILSLLLMSLPGGTTASPGPKTHVHLGRLAGKVLGPKGAPVVGARVTVETSDGRHPHATSTDTQGRFSFPNILAGPYDARAYRDGSWSAGQHNVIVRTGKTTAITLTIIAEKPSEGFAARH